MTTATTVVDPDAIAQAMAALNSEVDPIYFLLQCNEQNAESVYNLQGATAAAGESTAQISYQNVLAGNALLDADMQAVQSAGDDTATQKASSKYGEDSTKVTNTNDGFNTVSQTMSTGVSDLTRQAANAMDSASAVTDNQSGVTSLLQGWGN